MRGIKIKIDVSKIDKTALFKGQKGTYLDAVMWPTPDSQYGDDWRIVQDLGKDRREEKGAIIGNAKNIPDQGGGQRAAAPVAKPAAPPRELEEGEEQLPF
jgi:hypothetical protein